MKVRTVKRYTCDFCKKSNCSSFSIKTHEKHCTLNPKRICRMCNAMQEGQSEMKDLIALVPKPDSTQVCPSLNVSAELRDKANDCPICILAAIRQAEIPVHYFSGFDFKKECSEQWAQINEERCRAGIYE